MERVLTWGKGCFGFLASAQGMTAKETLVLLNAGHTHRAGPHRLSVAVSRAAATEGFPTFRFDLPGLADGVMQDSTDHVDAAIAALNAVAVQTGCERFVLGGLCSAADLAWRVALLDPRVVGLLLIDPVARPGFWFTFGRVTLMLRRGPAAVWRWWMNRRSKAPVRVTDADLRDWPAPGQEAQQLATLVERGVHSFMLYTGGAATYMTHAKQLDAGFGPALHSTKVCVAHWKDVDHLFFRPDDRERLCASIAQWLCRTFARNA